MSIISENEKTFGNFSVDNYLVNSNLIIEVMGSYFHADHRIYTNSLYWMQKDRIKRDKAKHSLLDNKYGIQILYLWEEDINNNIDLCKKLIFLYIDSAGKLNNYHSFNYILENNEIVLKRDISIPYMDYDVSLINSTMEIKNKEKYSRKQVEKWITFKCETCGKEKEELISHYNKKKHHFCSYECHRLFRKAHKKGRTPKKKSIN